MFAYYEIPGRSPLNLTPDMPAFVKTGMEDRVTHILLPGDEFPEGPRNGVVVTVADLDGVQIGNVLPANLRGGA